MKIILNFQTRKYLHGEKKNFFFISGPLGVPAIRAKGANLKVSNSPLAISVRYLCLPVAVSLAA
jgi:hypothetical protein